MEKLPENYRFALEWKYVDRLSVKEIARRLETTEKSAESILFRARNALRQQLRGEQPVTRCQSLQAGQDSSDASSGSTENSSAGNDTDVPKQPSAVLGSRMASES